MSVENHIETLRSRHRDLDERVAMLESSPSADDIEITSLKKQKLHLKEQIEKLESAS